MMQDPPVHGTADGLVAIGRVIKPHGINGEVSVEVLTDILDRFAAGTSVVVDGVPRHITASRPHQSRMLLLFQGIHDRNAAETLRGLVIEAPPLDAGTSDHYFVHELIGAEVRTVDGGALGVVQSLVELPSAAEYDLLEVRRRDGSVWLLPAVDEYVEISADDGLVIWVVDPPEGLIDASDTADGREGPP